MAIAAAIKLASRGAATKGAVAGSTGMSAIALDISNSSIKKIGSEMKGALDAVMKVVFKPIFDILTAIFGVLFMKIVRTLSNTFEILGDIGRIIVDIGRIFFNLLTGNLPGAKEAFDDLLDDSVELLKDLADLAIDSFKRLKKTILKEATETEEKAKQLYEDMKKNTINQIVQVKEGMIVVWNDLLSQLKRSALAREVDVRSVDLVEGKKVTAADVLAVTDNAYGPEDVLNVTDRAVADLIMGDQSNQNSGGINHYTFNGMVPDQVIEFVNRKLGKASFTQGRI